MRDPDLIDLGSDPRVAFIVLGGSTLQHWVNERNLKDLQRPEIHLYDRDVSSYSDSINQVNSRGDGSWGVLTKKYEIENYLHPKVVRDGLGVDIDFGEDDDVPSLLKEAKGWNPNTSKRKLAQRAFPLMTAELVDEVDPDGEVESWLRRIVATIS